MKEICTLENMAALLKISSKNIIYLWSNFPKCAPEYYIPPLEYFKENYMQATFFFFLLLLLFIYSPTHRMDNGNIHSTHELEMFLFGEIFA